MGGLGPLTGDQAPVPRTIVSGVTSVATCPRQSSPNPMSQDREAPAFVVVETQALPGELGLQNAILLRQKRDDIRLLAMQPATEGRG